MRDKNKLFFAVAAFVIAAIAGLLLYLSAYAADMCISSVGGDEPPVVVCWLWLPVVVK